MRVLVLGLFLIAGSSCLSVRSANADGWKDESGKGFSRGHFSGETPAWARGKGYWDGHFKRGESRVQMPYPHRSYLGFCEPPRAFHHGEDFYKEQWKARREYERESFKAWQEWQRERNEFQRERREQFKFHH